MASLVPEQKESLFLVLTPSLHSVFISCFSPQMFFFFFAISYLYPEQTGVISKKNNGNKLKGNVWSHDYVAFFSKVSKIAELISDL